MHDHAQIKRALEERLEQLQARIGALSSELRRSDEPVSPDFAEQATATEGDEVLAALDSTGRKEYHEIMVVLGRIDAGTYGWCESCGEPIGDRRLHAMPAARTCIECASGQGS